MGEKMRLSEVEKLLSQDIVKLYRIEFHRDSIEIQEPTHLSIKIKSIKEIDLWITAAEIKGKTFWVTLFRNSPPYRHDCIW